jgi:hypothetical protein
MSPHGAAGACTSSASRPAPTESPPILYAAITMKTPAVPLPARRTGAPSFTAVAAPLTLTLAVLGFLALTAAPVLAHEGHGLPGAAHWHASDAFGFGLAVAVAGLAWLITRGR